MKPHKKIIFILAIVLLGSFAFASNEVEVKEVVVESSQIVNYTDVIEKQEDSSPGGGIVVWVQVSCCQEGSVLEPNTYYDSTWFIIEAMILEKIYC